MLQFKKKTLKKLMIFVKMISQKTKQKQICQKILSAKISYFKVLIPNKYFFYILNDHTLLKEGILKKKIM